MARKSFRDKFDVDAFLRDTWSFKDRQKETFIDIESITGSDRRSIADWFYGNINFYGICVLADYADLSLDRYRK